MRSALALVLLLAACGPAPDRSLLYAHAEARLPFYEKGPDGVYRAMRPGAVPSHFPAAKKPGTFRVFIVGGSIARLYQGPGDLEQALAPLLPEGRTLELLNAGMAGYDAAREELIVAQVAGLGADLIVLLSGHNESEELAPPLPLWRLGLGLWARQKGLLRARRALDDASLEAFEASLRRMARAARAGGAKLLLVRPPLNRRDGAPQGGVPRDPSAREGWIRLLLGDCRGAKAAWACGDAGRDDAARSRLAFLAARCDLKEGRPAEAARGFEAALALEPARRGRCGAACAAVLEKVAREEGALHADADAVFRALSGGRDPGLEAFSDRVHWRPSHHAWMSYALASALAEAGLANKPSPPPPPPAPKPGEEGWLNTLRYAATEARENGELSLIAVSYLQGVFSGWPKAASSPAAALAAAPPPAEGGLAWGAKPSQPGPALARHAAVARLLSGDAAGALRLYAEAGPARDAEDAAESAAAQARAGDKGGARAALDTAWRAGAAKPEGAADEGLRAAAKALLGAVPESYRRPGERAPDEAAGWSAALSSGTLEAAVKADRAGAAKAATGLLRAGGERAGLAEALFAALGEETAARKAACLPGRGPEGALSCARRLLKAGEKARAAERARSALSGSRAREAALLLQDAGDPSSAAAALERLSGQAPKDAGLACDAGTALFLAGRGEDAAAAFARARAADAASSCAASGLSLLAR